MPASPPLDLDEPRFREAFYGPDAAQAAAQPEADRGTAAGWDPARHPRKKGGPGGGQFTRVPGTAGPALRTPVPAKVTLPPPTAEDTRRLAAYGEAARKFAAAAAPAATALFGPAARQGWDGTLRAYRPGEIGAGVVGQLSWNGRMSLQDGMAAAIADVADPHARVRNPEAFAVLLHELIHGTIPENDLYDDHKDAYQEDTVAAIEEGFTELATIQHAPDWFDAAGIGDRDTDIIAVTDGHSVDNPVYARRQKALADQLEAAYEDLHAAGPAHLPVARKLLDAAVSVRSGFTGHLDETISQLATAGDADLTARARRLKALADELTATDMSAHATLSEYARRLQDSGRIRQGQAWGHYAQATAGALVWVEELARLDEQRATDRPGTPGWRHIRTLADEINREGPAGKVAVMTRQVIARFSRTGTVRPEVARRVRTAILENWGAGAAGAEDALYVAGQIVTDGETRDRIQVKFAASAAAPAGPATGAGREAAEIAAWAWADPKTRAAKALSRVNALAAGTADPGALREVQDTARMISRLAGSL